MGLGFDSFSMPLSSIPRVKWALRRFPHADARALVQRLLAAKTCTENEAAVHAAMRERLPALVPPLDDTVPPSDRDNPVRHDERAV